MNGIHKPIQMNCESIDWSDISTWFVDVFQNINQKNPSTIGKQKENCFHSLIHLLNKYSISSLINCIYVIMYHSEYEYWFSMEIIIEYISYFSINCLHQSIGSNFNGKRWKLSQEVVCISKDELSPLSITQGGTLN